MSAIYQKFEAYIKGELTGNELRNFESELASNEVLQKELELYKTVNNKLGSYLSNQEKITKIKGTLDAISGDFFQEGKNEPKVITMPQQRGRIIRLLAAAAVVVILSVIALRTLQKTSNPQYADLMELPEASLIEMNADEDQKLLVEAENTFNSRDFKTAIIALKTYSDKHPKQIEPKFYLALSYLELDETDAAENLLKEIATSDSTFSTEAIWYLALTKLKQGDEIWFKNYLRQIPKGSSRYEEAKVWLK